MNVLSLFDGISCGQIALNRAGIDYDNYFASEVDKHAIRVTQDNYPNTKQLGDVRGVSGYDLPKIDLLIGGSPCQGFSFAGKQLNFEDPRSKLFFEYVRILNECRERNPDIKFLLENVRMKKESLDVITELLGVEPVFVNSADYSAQNRPRYYWANIPRREGRPGLLLSISDVMTNDGYWFRPDMEVLDSHKSTVGLKCVAGISKNKKWKNSDTVLQRNFSQGERVYHVSGKSSCLSASSGGSTGPGSCLITDEVTPVRVRKITPLEAERLQTIPDNYTSILSDSQRRKAIGNAWTVDVIVSFFENLK